MRKECGRNKIKRELEEQRWGNCFNVRRGGMDERNDDRTDKWKEWESSKGERREVNKDT
jgi:hypothetical protein